MVYSQIPITIPVQQVYRYLGFRTENNVPPEWEKRIDATIKQAKIYMKPKGVIETTEVCPELQANWEWTSQKYGGKQVKRILAKSRKVSFVAATIGREYEETGKEILKDEGLAQTYLWDVVGTVAVHQVIKGLSKYIQPIAKREGLRLSPRMAPGYGDWQIEAQTLYFEKLNLEQIGMTLNESLMMEPKHSLTGLVAWTDQGYSTNAIGKCNNCAKVDCIFRVI